MKQLLIERKARELIDIVDLELHINMVEVFLSMMKKNRLDYCGEIKIHLAAIETMFDEAYDAAEKLLLREEENESYNQAKQ